MATATPMRISPLGRVEGDLDLRIEVTDRVVTDAWTEASMFRGFEIILRGKDPQAGLIVTPRICGIAAVVISTKRATRLIRPGRRMFRTTRPSFGISRKAARPSSRFPAGFMRYSQST